MTNYTEKATTLYEFNYNNNSDVLDAVLIDLADQNGEPIQELSDFMDNFSDNYELVEIVQASDHFDTDDTYIMSGVYRRDYVTGNSITELVGIGKAIEWIDSALEYDPESVAELEDESED